MFKGIWENLPAKAERVPGSQKVLSAGKGSPLHMPQGTTRRSPKRGLRGHEPVVDTLIGKRFDVLIMMTQGLR